jgi:Flp pilus assembly secretin CpaC
MRRLLNILPLALLVATLGAARAEDQVKEKNINVDWQEAQIIKLDRPAASVIIGDPTVADVSLEDPSTIVLFGKAPGETNMIVFDGNHKLLVSASVTVTPEVARHVSIIGPVGGVPTEALYACGRRCVRVVSPSDVVFKSTVSSQLQATANTNQSASGAPGGQGGSAAPAAGAGAPGAAAPAAATTP